MRRGVAAVLAAALCGCAHDQIASAPQSVPLPPAPQKVYFKEGASNEEFQRTRARCFGQAEIAESSSTDPNPFSRTGTWIVVLHSCMRADGWVLVDKK